MGYTINTIIALGNWSTRAAYISLLEKDSRIKITGSVGNGRRLLKLLLEGQHPDVVILGLEMPVMGGFETLCTLKKEFPDIKVIIFTRYFTPRYIDRFRKCGANAYLSKDCSPEILFDAIHSVYMNDYYTFDYSNIYLPYEPFETDFTKKEIEVIKEICKGKDNEKISKALKVSTNTVDTHRKSIYIKAGVRSGVQLMLFAMVTGIVSPFEVTSLSLNIYRE